MLHLILMERIAERTQFLLSMAFVADVVVEKSPRGGVNRANEYK